jgi:hypothetical protein
MDQGDHLNGHFAAEVQLWRMISGAVEREKTESSCFWRRAKRRCVLESKANGRPARPAGAQLQIERIKGLYDLGRLGKLLDGLLRPPSSTPSPSRVSCRTKVVALLMSTAVVAVARTTGAQCIPSQLAQCNVDMFQGLFSLRPEPLGSAGCGVCGRRRRDCVQRGGGGGSRSPTAFRGSTTS